MNALNGVGFEVCCIPAASSSQGRIKQGDPHRQWTKPTELYFLKQNIILLIRQQEFGILTANAGRFITGPGRATVEGGGREESIKGTWEICYSIELTLKMVFASEKGKARQKRDER